ncbi:MFS transporter [Kitasatospora sp. NPDC097605]|uniref:MFS transporter n=1 Tax=Kitasatospora sp. NPDC097605 TaxID=3157226 RepID=UPI003321A401
MTTTGALAPDGTAGRPGRAALPATYLLWLAGAQLGALGDAALAFALGWAAAAHGGGAAGLVLTAITVSRTALVLVGGAVADRLGARRVMLAGDAVMLAATLTLAAVAGGWGTPLRLLVLAAVVIGVVDAFYLPASGSMPRLLVGTGQLPRALALRQAGGQLAVLLGAPLGGALVAAGGLPGVALVDAASFAVVLLVLLRVPVPHRPGRQHPEQHHQHHQHHQRPRRRGGPGLPAEAAAGVRLAARDRLLRSALLLTGAAAGALLPVVSLLAPLLARTAGWGAGAAGLVAGGQGAGVLVVASLLAWRDGGGREDGGREHGARENRGTAGVGAAYGLCVAAAGIALLAVAPGPGTAVVGGVVTGAGSGLFACRIAPLVLGAAPEDHLSRVQALLTLVQSAALVLSTGLLGLLADAVGPRTPTALCAAATGAAGLLALASPVLRRGAVLAGRTGGGQSARAGRGRTRRGRTAARSDTPQDSGASGGGDE